LGGWPIAALVGALALGFLAPAAQGKTLVIEGAGDGHGVGMSQDGALGYAEHGYGYRQILAHYYAGTSLHKIGAGRKIKVLVGSHVLTLPIETYVRGVVAAEMPASWPKAALDAQAIASRSYALTTDVGGRRFDVYSDTRSQVYEGRSAETRSTNAAVAATRGQVVVYHGAPVTTYFFASSGGMTEDIQNTFIGAAPEPWLRGVVDKYETSASRWKVSFTFQRAQARLRGLVRGSLRGIEVLRRGFSPRIVSARVLGSGGATTVSGPQLEARLGLESTWAYFLVRSGSSLVREPDRSHWHASVAHAPNTGGSGGSSAPGTGGVSAP